MHLSYTIVGLLVGMCVGLTGMGGGAMMTPILILTGWAPPSMAVGTDLLWSSITKAVGAAVHWQQGTVNFLIVRRLAMGSIPGAIVGLVVLEHVRKVADTRYVEHLIVRCLGIALILVACSLAYRSIRGAKWLPPAFLPKYVRFRPALTTILGFVIGFFVSTTSVGSGSLILAALVGMYRWEPLKRLVGSDVFHALLLVSVSALGHWSMGSVNVPLLGGLLVGSIPGVWIGSKFTTILPERFTRPILATVLLGFGLRLL